MRLVGTMRKSIDTKSLTWFFRNALHVGEGAFLDRTRYLSTVDFATLMPSFPNSPTMRGVPHSGLAPETLRMSSRISSLISGLPGFPRPVGAKAFTLPCDNGRGLDKNQNLPPRGPVAR